MPGSRQSQGRASRWMSDGGTCQEARESRVDDGLYLDCDLMRLAAGAENDNLDSRFSIDVDGTQDHALLDGQAARAKAEAMHSAMSNANTPNLRLRAPAQKALGGGQGIVRHFELAGFNVDGNNLALMIRLHLGPHLPFIDGCARAGHAL